MDYPTFFRTLTGNAPFPYQSQLATQAWPQLLDVPTGLGKTAASIVAWLYKRLNRDAHTGTRLVYCLPMRVLVQQTESAARTWCEKSAQHFIEKGLVRPTVHVLMGGDVDEQWENHPEHSAILIGTQDMLLSRALNRGYAMSRYKWPMHFSLLNNDCLWVFDETQLVGVGIETSAQLQGLRNHLGAHASVHTLWMSATLGERQLGTVDHPRPASGWAMQQLTDADLDSSIVQTRVTAKKPIQPLTDLRLDKESEKKTYVEALATQVLSEHTKRKGLTLVIVNRVARAQALYAALVATQAFDEDTLALVHSRFRSEERARHEAVLHATDRDRVVVATQAVEAGVDVSARTMFTELAPWSSLVQRFGRCNRYGVDDAAIFWVDVDTADPKQKLALPYEAEELDTGRRLLKGLDADAGPNSLGAVAYEPPLVVRPVLRRRDVLDLFDTAPDLSGNDLDVSRYVRDGEDTDVQFYWRDFEGSPTSALATPERHELCRASITAAREFLDKLKKKRQQDKTQDKKHGSSLQAWIWDPLQNQWNKAERIQTGNVVLLHPNAGGYDPRIGWTGEAAPKQPTPPTQAQASTSDGQESDEGDPATVLLQGRWVTLKDHLGHVRDEAKALAVSLGLEAQSDALSTAGLWHDVGKAHEAFQQKLLAPLEDQPELLPAGKGPWAKSNHRLRSPEIRKHFRHELASALAWLAAGDGKEERFTNLVAYLVAAHHGKVRLAIRSLPGESVPGEAEQLYARGVWDGDVLPPFELPDGRTFTDVSLDLSVMRLGGNSWLERMLSLRDAEDLGPFRLALLETVVRVADWRASRKEQEGAYDA